MGWPARHATSVFWRSSRRLLPAGAARVRARGTALPERRATRPEHASALAEQRSALLLLFLVMLLQVGCDRTMTEDDCRRIGETMRAAWTEEVKKVSPTESDRTEKAAVVLETEGEKLSSEWTSDCKRELAGRVVDASELDCISRSRTLDELSRCAAQ